MCPRGSKETLVAHRISQIMVQVILLDEFDAPHQQQPIGFQGDADGTALEKAKAFLEELSEKPED